MVYAGDKKRQYQLEWMKKRRQEWISENGPCQLCGEDDIDDLEVNHVNPLEKKLNPSKIWSLSKTNPIRIEELNKCEVLCYYCHGIVTEISKSVEYNPWLYYTEGMVTNLSIVDIRCIYMDRIDGFSLRTIASWYKVDEGTIRYVLNRISTYGLPPMDT